MPLLTMDVLDDVLQMDVADAFVKHPMNAYWKETAMTYINLREVIFFKSLIYLKQN